MKLHCLYLLIRFESRASPNVRTNEHYTADPLSSNFIMAICRYSVFNLLVITPVLLTMLTDLVEDLPVCSKVRNFQEAQVFQLFSLNLPVKQYTPTDFVIYNFSFINIQWVPLF